MAALIKTAGAVDGSTRRTQEFHRADIHRTHSEILRHLTAASKIAIMQLHSIGEAA
jgi:hypothetical protein